MKVRHELTKMYGLISLMENFGGTKSLRNILGELKTDVDIFRGTIYLFNPKIINKNDDGDAFACIYSICPLM